VGRQCVQHHLVSHLPLTPTGDALRGSVQDRGTRRQRGPTNQKLKVRGADDSLAARLQHLTVRRAARRLGLLRVSEVRFALEMHPPHQTFRDAKAGVSKAPRKFSPTVHAVLLCMAGEEVVGSACSFLTLLFFLKSIFTFFQPMPLQNCLSGIGTKSLWRDGILARQRVRNWNKPISQALKVVLAGLFLWPSFIGWLGDESDTRL
jgi:hypothetical protein